MSKSPVSILKEKFGDKAKLVAALQPMTEELLWVDRVNAKKGLAHVSNAKLLRLHALLTEVKKTFGSREKLIDAICEAEKRSKDEGYRKRLAAYPVPRLMDLYRASARRTKAKSPAAARPATAETAPKTKESRARAKAAAPAGGARKNKKKTASKAGAPAAKRPAKSTKSAKGK